MTQLDEFGRRWTNELCGYFSQPHSLLEIAKAKKTKSLRRLIFLLLRGCCCASVVVVVVGLLLVCCARAERRGWRESERRLHASLARPGRFSIVTIGNRQSRHWRGGACVFSSRIVVVVARAPARQRQTGRAERTHTAEIFCCRCWRARSCDGALLMACAPCLALCARLGVVCATRRCVRGSTLCALGAVCAARRCERSAL